MDTPELPGKRMTTAFRTGTRARRCFFMRKEEGNGMGEEKKTIQGKMEVAGLVGPLWFIGWLFTIGFTHLTFGKAVWAIVIWPYYIGRALG
jgi:hypothetical protein